MVANDSSISSGTGNDAENINPKTLDISDVVKTPVLSKFAQRLLLLKKPLNLSESSEIDLKPVEIEKKEPVKEEEHVYDPEKTTEWIMKTTGLKIKASNAKSPKLPGVSPKRLTKYELKKKELKERILQKTREEQALRYQIFNEDNEILDQEEEEEFDFSDAELEDGDGQEIVPKPKKKIVVNEEVEGVEYIDEEDEDNDVLDEEEEELDDEEEEDVEEIREKNDFVDDEASDDEENEVDYPSPATPQKQKSRIIMDDSEDEEVPKDSGKFSDSLEIPDIPLNNSNVSDSQRNLDENEVEREQEPSMNESNEVDISANSKNADDFLNVLIPDFPSQMVEPSLQHYAESISEPAESQPMMIFESQTETEKDELMDLCSGSFGGTFKTGSTLSSKINPLDFISQNSFGTPDPILSHGTIKSAKSFDDTLEYIAIMQREFEEADDTVADMDSDSDSDIEDKSTEVRKRKRIVNYSDDEDELIPPAKKVSNLFDSDDEDDSDKENNHVNTKEDNPVSPTMREKNENPFPASLLDDEFFTTDDPSDVVVDERPTSRKWVNDDDDEDDYDMEVEGDKRIKKFFDEEAELSGDDVGPDDEESDGEENEYEKQECDEEEYDQEELRNNLALQYNKQMQNEEYRRLLKLQELFIGDDLQTSNMDRSFRRTMRNEITDEDWQKLVKMNPVLADFEFEESDEEENEELLKKSLEVKKWRSSQMQSNEKDDADMDIMGDFSDSPLLAIGHQIAESSTHKTKTIKTSHTSFLKGTSNLGMLIKESSTTEIKKHVLFTARK